VDDFFLEIISEGEVPEHLEKSVVARGTANIFKVVVLSGYSHAFLGRRSTGIAARFIPEKQVLELDHPGVGEEEGGIVRRNERGAFNTLMSPLLEITEE
jgi:hypothetical protein